MKLGVTYDLGEGPLTKRISVKAQVGWELRSKKATGDFLQHFTVDGLVGLLFEQLRIDDALPDGVKTEKQLVDLLVDIDPAEVSEVRPTEPGAQPGSSSESAPPPESPSTT